MRSICHNQGALSLSAWVMGYSIGCVNFWPINKLDCGLDSGTLKALCLLAQSPGPRLSDIRK
jgi:hypothetical protein